MSRLLPKFKSALRTVMPTVVLDRVRNRRRKRRAQVVRRGFLTDLRPSDIFLVGHPKSGNTWLAYMLAVLVHDDHEGRINISNVGDFVPTIHARDRAIAKHGDLPMPRIFRNEGPLFAELYPKTIYIVRDPRSVLLSYYHHCVHDTGEHDWRIEDFVDEMLREGCIRRLEPFLVRWDRQVEYWTQRATQQAVKVVRYEDLKKDRRKELEGLASFIGIKSSEERLDEAAERGDFSSMRAEENVHGAESYAGEKGARGFFVRKGQTDSWKEEMPGSVISSIEQAFGPGMKQFGYVD